MNRSLRLPSVTATLLIAGAIAFSLTRNSIAQEQKRPPLPLPEMQRLSKLYVGTWTYTETYPKSASSPNAAVNTGIYTSELGPGGNSIINRFHSKGPVGEFEGLLVMTWDPREKAYKAYVLADSFPGAVVETGQWENDALVYRTELSIGVMKLALRNTTKFLDGGKIESEQFSSANGAPETLVVHVDAVKK
ncbi:MAG TPA: hypothetical protein VEI54_06825 [Candidatus Limnocylindrales bacterium]|nr:hypothetical protein [Candidatus Limnocylindrales bacterium]